jgi:vacuolar protein sorting-associated protein VTA1
VFEQAAKMATNLPPKLKTPEITRYVRRAAQLQEAKPVIAYWCKCTALVQTAISNLVSGNYWVVDQILSKGLHSSDAESMKYTTNLMDTLEQVILPPLPGNSTQLTV